MEQENRLHGRAARIGRANAELEKIEVNSLMFASTADAVRFILGRGTVSVDSLLRTDATDLAMVKFHRWIMTNLLSR
ncbi:hypothetical protein Poly41_27520 [Novipirellula artificiosorum]|uniref:Uncharacterized protein n=1 Tax=Novipirellula artificiosorum TaxID=2528016 RepID=A0A5C6DTC2_9BACT|nr:hypothetical protein Poly41_27520 [Novipirellula artificiosorum]